jgi:hypothetical protein
MANTPIQDFIQTYLMLDERNRAIRAANITEVSQRAQQIGAVMTIAQQTSDPDKQRELLRMFGPMLGPGGSETLAHLLSSSSPTAETLRNRGAYQGVQAMDEGQLGRVNAEAATTVLTGQNQGQVAQSGLTAGTIGSTPVQPGWQTSFMQRLLTGQNAGEYALSQAQAALDPTTLTQAAQIGLRTRMSPLEEQNVAQGWQSLGLQRRGQDINAAQGWASNRLGWAQLTSQSALAEAGMAVDLRRAALQAAGNQDQAGLDLMKEARQTMDVIQQGNLNAAQRAEYFNYLRNVYGQLRTRGYTEFKDFDPSRAAQNVYTPTPFSNIFGTGRGGSTDAWRPGQPVPTPATPPRPR